MISCVNHCVRVIFLQTPHLDDQRRGPYGFNPLALPPRPDCGQVGSGEPLQSPLRPPGTDVKVGTESKGDVELPPSRWWSELTVIHTN